MKKAKTIDLGKLYKGTAKPKNLSAYIKRATSKIEGGEEVTLTGQAPIWLYLAVAHALHGKVRKLIYNSPVTGDVVIFDHSP